MTIFIIVIIIIIHRSPTGRKQLKLNRRSIVPILPLLLLLTIIVHSASPQLLIWRLLITIRCNGRCCCCWRLQRRLVLGFTAILQQIRIRKTTSNPSNRPLTDIWSCPQCPPASSPDSCAARPAPTGSAPAPRSAPQCGCAGR